MSEAFSGVGTLFRRWNTGTQQWENIAEINNINGPGMTRDTIDVTSLDSTGGYREFIAGFRDGGTVQLSMNMSRRWWDVMLGDFESDDLQVYNIVLPDNDSTSIVFDGLVTEMPLTIPPDDKVTMDVTIKVSGQPTTDSGASTGI